MVLLPLTIAGSAIVVLYFLFGRKYFAGGVNNITKDLTGKVVVVTGSNTGIGKEAAKQLARMGATLVLACRSADRAEPAVDEIKRETGNKNVEFLKLDLGELKSVKEFANEFKKKYQRLDILINNAGLVTLDREETKDGFEKMFGTNHLGHFYLTTLLLDVIKKSAPSRIVNLSSMGHNFANWDWNDLQGKKKFSSFPAYGNSKLANIWFSKELQRRLAGSDVKVVSLHPGSIITEIGRKTEDSVLYNIAFKYLFSPVNHFVGKTIEQGAQTTLYCALENQDKLVGGGYYSDCKVGKESKLAGSVDDQKRLWEESEKLVASKVGN